MNTPAGDTENGDIDTEPSSLQGRRQLFGDEKPWAQRHDYLLERGYKLRPRYSPGWTASWKGVPRYIDEDAIVMTFHGSIMDARRQQDNTIVMMKVVDKNSTELEITRHLSSPKLISDPRNHSVPLLDLLDDPLDPTKQIIVLPLLRKLWEPPFASVNDCVQFIEQTLEAIAFLHENNIAHRDCFVANIMMDARLLYPQGWHPQDTSRAPSGRLVNAVPKRQGVGGVRYYLIDFGISSISKNEVLGDHGQQRAPELSDTVAYNPYKVDIWLLGEAFKYLMLQKFQSVEWLRLLTNAMTQDDPDARPTAEECIEQFNVIKAKITPLARARRLHPVKSEWKIFQVVRDVSYAVSVAIWALKSKKKPLEPFKPTERAVDQLTAPDKSVGAGAASVVPMAKEPSITIPESRANTVQPSKGTRPPSGKLAKDR